MRLHLVLQEHIVHTTLRLAWTLALLVLIIYSFSVVLTEMVVQYCWQPAGEAAALCAEKAEDQPEGVLRTFFSSVPESHFSEHDCECHCFGGVHGKVNVRILK